MTFNKLHDCTHAIYNELSILKFQDLIYLQNCIFMLQIEQNESLDVPFQAGNIVENIKFITQHQKFKNNLTF